MRCASRLLAKNSELLRALCAEQIAASKEVGTFKAERPLSSPQSAHVSVSGTAKSVINLCANNYLGLANHPRIVARAEAALKQYGFGMSSVRFICGTQDQHRALEADISRFLQREDAILYPSCFDANAGVFEALLGEQDVVISDALNHASIIDGIRLCKAKRLRYAHMDLAELERHLQASQSARIRMIVTDGVFSMDGDIAPLDKICELADKYDATVFVDDSHATGFIGPAGRGTAHLFGVHERVDIVNSTLGKALGGGSGGFSSGSKEVVEMQRQKGRPYLFSNAVAPALVAGAREALAILEPTSDAESPQLAALRRNTALFRHEMGVTHGFKVLGHPECPIAPILLGDARLAGFMSQHMLERGVYVVGFSFPVVPKGQARIRVQLSAAHTEEDIKAGVKAFVDARDAAKAQGLW